MTAHTPAPKASSASTLLASLAAVPPLLLPSVKGDFLAAILHALAPQPAGMDNPPSLQPAAEKKSPPAGSDAYKRPFTIAVVSDPVTASQWLALSTSSPPTPSKLPAQTVPARAISVVLPALDDAPAQVQTASEASPSKAADAEKTLLLTVQPAPLKEPPISPPPTSGTSVADTSQRMSFTLERHEIAGSMEQKLPPVVISSVNSVDTVAAPADNKAKLSLPFSWHDAPSEPLVILDLSSKAASPAAPVAETTVDTAAPASGASPLERVERMISHETMTVRQMGAQTLGVSLKLDSNTHLYLQLTNHNGLVQASVRCERGSFAPQDSQWAQLQQSLARQNVELLPMSGGSNLNFQQPSDERTRQIAAREDWAAAGAAVQPAQSRKQRDQNRPRKNWESWA